MSDLRVIDAHSLMFKDKRYRCAIGAGGFTRTKKEGDKATPVGSFALRECWYRGDRIEPPRTLLPLRAITPADGWCDDPSHRDYNRHVRLPFAASHERLHLSDPVYDIIVPLGYNDDPVMAGAGSAIFLHLAKPDYAPTAGCIAVARKDMLEILSAVKPDTRIVVGPL